MSNLAKDTYTESSDYDLKKPYKKELFGPDLTPYKVIDDSNEPAPPDVQAYKIASFLKGFEKKASARIAKHFAEKTFGSTPKELSKVIGDSARKVSDRHYRDLLAKGIIKNMRGMVHSNPFAASDPSLNYIDTVKKYREINKPLSNTAQPGEYLRKLKEKLKNIKNLKSQHIELKSKRKRLYQDLAKTKEELSKTKEELKTYRGKNKTLTKKASSFWDKFFGQKEKKKKQFWDNEMSAAEVSMGSPTMFSQGFDTDRDVYTSGYIL